MVCSVGVAFESWFQVELAQMLASRAEFETIRFVYYYPGTRQKADLSVGGKDGRVVFEMKCFVQGADANKVKNWPSQLRMLAELVERGGVCQGVALSTFFGYSPRKTVELVSRFYPSPRSYFRPRPFFDDKLLQLAIAITPANGDGTVK